MAIANGVLQTVVRQSLPEVDTVEFHDLVDGGEGGGGEEAGEGPRKLSSTPLRMCRYAGGADGVAFGERRGEPGDCFVGGSAQADPRLADFSRRNSG